MSTFNVFPFLRCTLCDMTPYPAGSYFQWATMHRASKSSSNRNKYCQLENPKHNLLAGNLSLHLYFLLLQEVIAMSLQYALYCSMLLMALLAIICWHCYNILCWSNELLKCCMLTTAMATMVSNNENDEYDEKLCTLDNSPKIAPLLRKMLQKQKLSQDFFWFPFRESHSSSV